MGFRSKMIAGSSSELALVRAELTAVIVLILALVMLEFGFGVV